MKSRRFCCNPVWNRAFFQKQKSAQLHNTPTPKYIKISQPKKPLAQTHNKKERLTIPSNIILILPILFYFYFHWLDAKAIGQENLLKNQSPWHIYNPNPNFFSNLKTTKNGLIWTKWTQIGLIYGHKRRIWHELFVCVLKIKIYKKDNL